MSGNGANTHYKGSATLAAARETSMDRLVSTPIEIGGEVVYIGELSLDQTIAIARLIGEATVYMDEAQKAALRRIAAQGIKKPSLDKTNATQANIAAFLQILNRNTARSLFATLIDRDEEWVGHNLKLRATLRIIVALLKHNDPEELKALFFEVANSFKDSLGNLLRSSSSSPPTASPSPKSDDTVAVGSQA